MNQINDFFFNETVRIFVNIIAQLFEFLNDLKKKQGKGNIFILITLTMYKKCSVPTMV